jgi:hypothetical protein
MARTPVETVTRPYVTEAEPHCFVAEASTLGFPIGGWPARLNTDLGNKLPFILRSVSDGNFARYEQANGCITLTVFND